MRLVIKGLDYTEVRTTRKDSSIETIQHWRLSRPRKQSECGVWENGEQIKSYEEMTA